MRGRRRRVPAPEWMKKWPEYQEMKQSRTVPPDPEHLQDEEAYRRDERRSLDSKNNIIFV
jgi:hypothetical protein